MERDYFLDKVSCKFAIITNSDNCHIVTKELGIEPDRFFNKGDSVVNKYSDSIITRPYGLWEMRSEPTMGDGLNISLHINYFIELLGDKIDIIEKLKKQYNFECIFSIDIETEDAGAGFDLYTEEINFINKIASRFSCHFISKENII